MKRKIFLILFVFLLIVVPVKGEENPDFLDLNNGKQNISVDEGLTVDFIAHDGVFRNPFSDYRSRGRDDKSEQEKLEEDPQNQIPFVLQGIINYEGRKAALLSGPDFTKIAFESEVIEGFRLTGIYDKFEMISLYYNGETIRMKIGGDILD
ncbi:MAG: hypothetical protein ACOCQ1_01635 [Halanaerobiaceae bacterium]